MNQDQQKITITIEQVPGGAVKVVSDPSFETMARMELSGEGLSSANAYALIAINAIRKASKQADAEKRGLIVEIPKALKI
jgi:hypothetical protein